MGACFGFTAAYTATPRHVTLFSAIFISKTSAQPHFLLLGAIMEPLPDSHSVAACRESLPDSIGTAQILYAVVKVPLPEDCSFRRTYTAITGQRLTSTDLYIVAGSTTRAMLSVGPMPQLYVTDPRRRVKSSPYSIIIRGEKLWVQDMPWSYEVHGTDCVDCYPVAFAVLYRDCDRPKSCLRYVTGLAKSLGGWGNDVDLSFVLPYGFYTCLMPLTLKFEEPPPWQERWIRSWFRRTPSEVDVTVV